MFAIIETLTFLMTLIIFMLVLHDHYSFMGKIPLLNAILPDKQKQINTIE